MKPSQSSIMQAYNLAKKSRRFDTGRLNRALALAQSSRIVYLKDGRIDVPSSTDGFHLVSWERGCDCEDYRRHAPPVTGFSQSYLKPIKKFPCKHMIAFALLKRAWDFESVGAGSEKN